MTTAEFIVEALWSDASWRRVSMTPATICRPAGALAVLDQLRGAHPGRTFRLASRVAPGFTPADEAAVRAELGDREGR